MNHSERHDRALLLHGAKRNIMLSLAEVKRYGADSFGDPDYVRLYGMSPDEWYARGIRILGRTAVECTRDAPADRIGHDLAALSARRPSQRPTIAFDPFAGSCNTLYWILRHKPGSSGVAGESDPQVHALTRTNITQLDLPIELIEADFGPMLAGLELPPGHDLVAFVAPPWGTALDETSGLDLRRTTPPILDIVECITSRYHDRYITFAIHVYEKVNAESLAEVRAVLDWSDIRIFNLNEESANHGILLGSVGWSP